MDQFYQDNTEPVTPQKKSSPKSSPKSSLKSSPKSSPLASPKTSPTVTFQKTPPPGLHRTIVNNNSDANLIIDNEEKTRSNMRVIKINKKNNISHDEEDGIDNKIKNSNIKNNNNSGRNMITSEPNINTNTKTNSDSNINDNISDTENVSDLTKCEKCCGVGVFCCAPAFEKETNTKRELIGHESFNINTNDEYRLKFGLQSEHMRRAQPEDWIVQSANLGPVEAERTEKIRDLIEEAIKNAQPRRNPKGVLQSPSCMVWLR
jgi:hypothetical protein